MRAGLTPIEAIRTATVNAADHLKLSGLSQVNYQVGDGVQLIENYNSGRGDTIEVYGYSAPTATGLVNGQFVLYFGPNAALVISGYQPQNGVPLTGMRVAMRMMSTCGALRSSPRMWSSC